MLKEHLMRLKQTAGTEKASASYHSPETQNEFVNFLGNHVKEILVNDIKAARYFGVMFDSTPDMLHTTRCLR